MLSLNNLFISFFLSITHECLSLFCLVIISSNIYRMAKTWKIIITLIISCYFYIAHATELTINYSMSDVKKMPRFWANTGFAPPEPLDKVTKYLASDDVRLNLEIVGSLPNNGLKNVRIHWLLNLLSIKR